MDYFWDLEVQGLQSESICAKKGVHPYNQSAVCDPEGKS